MSKVESSFPDILYALEVPASQPRFSSELIAQVEEFRKGVLTI